MVALITNFQRGKACQLISLLTHLSFCCTFKGTKLQDFLTQVFSWICSLLGPDFQAKQDVDFCFLFAKLFKFFRGFPAVGYTMDLRFPL
jgi:hypothetical protein